MQIESALRIKLSGIPCGICTKINYINRLTQHIVYVNIRTQYIVLFCDVLFAIYVMPNTGKLILLYKKQRNALAEGISAAWSDFCIGLP